MGASVKKSPAQCHPLLILIGFTTALLSACGGGGGGGDSSGEGTANSDYQSLLVSAGTFAPYAPSATVAATKRLNQFVSGGFSLGGGSQGCEQPLTSVTVFEQTHTSVAGAAGVTDTDLQEAADYIEAAVVELRATLGVVAAMAFGGNKVRACVQNETLTVPGGGTPLASADSGGGMVTMSPSAYFLRQGARDSIHAGYGKFIQDIYKRTMAHEALHIYSYRIRDLSSADAITRWGGAYTDHWFEEGMGRYMEFGRNTVRSKTALLASLNAKNPMTEFNRSLPRGELDYDAAAAIFSYLFSPAGANNPPSTYRTFMEKMWAEFAALQARCRVANPAAECPTTADRETSRARVFTAAFESTFKERDGSPMRLRSGPNNLQDSLVTRLRDFW